MNPVTPLERPEAIVTPILAQFLDLLGPTAVTASGDDALLLRRFLGNRALTIAGGTSEVLHNVIGESILGLPRG